MRTFIFVIYILILPCCLFSEQVSLSHDFFSQQEVAKEESLAFLRIVDPNHNKSLIRFDHFPSDTELELVYERPLFEIKDVSKLTREEIETWAKVAINDSDPLPCYIFTSKGFLPGESVFYRIRDHDGTVLAEVEFIPQPIIAYSKNEQSKAVVEAHLHGVADLSLYDIKCYGFEENEKVRILSLSQDEIIQCELSISAGTAILSSPDVIDCSGGVGYYSIMRSNGEVLTVELPWGDHLTPYWRGERCYHCPERAFKSISVKVP